MLTKHFRLLDLKEDLKKQVHSNTRDDGLYITDNNLLSVLHVINEQENLQENNFKPITISQIIFVHPTEGLFEIDQWQQTTIPTAADVIFLTCSKKTSKQGDPIFKESSRDLELLTKFGNNLRNILGYSIILNTCLTLIYSILINERNKYEEL